jgi:thiosulfate/3-mercaptopyruvate sulfurtransferase
MTIRSAGDVVMGIETLRERLFDRDLRIVDCRFSLAEPERGERDHLQSHIPGAVYAHLDRDLSAPVEPGRTGRHPLPSVERFSQTLGAWGIDDQVQVVAYDDMGGAIAARLWWMLRWLGHETVAVLDGGWPAWLEEGGQVEAGPNSTRARSFVAHPRPDMIVDAEQVTQMCGSHEHRVLDARGADRYRGEVEPLDSVAGHVPGAILASFADNLDERGRFRSPEWLHERFMTILNGASPEKAAVYCGSGVTAAHDLLALAHAGIKGTKLYAGSWSEWIVDPTRPIATGEAP